MKIRVRCDCGEKLVANFQLAGKVVKCPTCGALIRLPRMDEVTEQVAFNLLNETERNLKSDSQQGRDGQLEDERPDLNVSPTGQLPADSGAMLMTDWTPPVNTSSVGRTRSTLPKGQISTFPELWSVFVAMVSTKIRSAPTPMLFAAGAAVTTAAFVLLWVFGSLRFSTPHKTSAGNESARTGVKLSVLVNALNATPQGLDESPSHDFVFANRFEGDHPRAIFGDTQSQMFLTGYGDAENLDEIWLMMGVVFFSDEGGEGAVAFDRCMQRITATVDPSWVGEVSDSWNRNMFRLFKGPGVVMEIHNRGLTARAVTINWADSPHVVFSIGPTRSKDRRQEPIPTKANRPDSEKSISESGIQLAILMTYMNFAPLDLESKFLHKFVLRDCQDDGRYRTYGDLHSGLQLVTSGPTNDLKSIKLAMRLTEFFNEDRNGKPINKEGNGAGAFGRCVQRMTAAVDASWVEEIYDTLNKNMTRIFIDQENAVVRQKRGLTASFVVKNDLIVFTIEISGRDARHSP